MRGELHIPIKGVYFDEIKAGTKTHEFRLITKFWRSRLHNRAYKRIILLRGYPPKGGIEGETRLTRNWIGVDIRQITHEHFGADPVHVFAIDVTGKPT